MTKRPLPIYFPTNVEDQDQEPCMGCDILGSWKCDGKGQRSPGKNQFADAIVYTREGFVGKESDPIDVLVVADTLSVRDTKAGGFFQDEIGQAFLKKMRRQGFDRFVVIPAVRCFPGGEVDHYQLDKSYSESGGFRKRTKPIETAANAAMFCQGYVKRAIMDYRPKIVLAMGPLAKNALGRTEHLRKLMSTPIHPKPGIKSLLNHEGTVFTWDRFQADCDPKALRDLMAAPARLRHLADHGVATERGRFDTIQVTTLDTVPKVREFVDLLLYTTWEEKPYLLVDYETQNLLINKEDNKPLNIGFSLSSNEDRAWAIPLYHPETPFSPEELAQVEDELRRLFTTKDAGFEAFVAHNAQFEERITKVSFWVWLGTQEVPLLCSQTMAHNEDENRKNGHNEPFTLETLASEYMGFTWYDFSGIKKKRDRLAQEPIARVNHYVGVDTAVNARLLNVLFERFHQEDSYQDMMRLQRHWYAEAIEYTTDLQLTGQEQDIELLVQLRAPDSSIQHTLRDLGQKLMNCPEVRAAAELLNQGAKVVKKKAGGSDVYHKARAAHGARKAQEARGDVFGEDEPETEEPVVKPTGQLFKVTRRNIEFNLDSNDHLKVLFKDVLGYDDAAESVDKKFQERHKDHPVVAMFQEYTKLATLDGTYLEPLATWLQSPNSIRDGRLRPSFNLNKTTTGRLSASEPNTQQSVKGDTQDKKQIKSLLRAARGMMLVALDYSQAEVRWLGILSGDENLANKYRKVLEIEQQLLFDPTNPELLRAQKVEGDLHMSTALEMFGLPLDLPFTDPKLAKKKRNDAKAICFGLIYGKNAASLAKDLGMSEEEAQETIDRWLGQFPKAAEWLRETERILEETGYIRSPFGRRRRLPESQSSDQSVRNRAKRQSRNTPVQSAASDMCVYAACRLRRAIEADPLLRGKVRLINTVHDSLVAEIVNDPVVIARYCEVAKKICTDPMLLKKDWDIDITVPLAVDFDIGYNAGNMREYTFTPCSLDRALHDAAVLRAQKSGTLLDDLEGKGLLYDEVQKAAA